MHSIRFKIAAITIGAVLTAILCISFASLLTIQAETDRMSVETMNLLVHDAGKSVEKGTEDIQQSVDLIAYLAADTLDSVVLVKGGVVGAGQRGQTPEQAALLDSYLAEYTESIRMVAATVASHTHGVVTYYYCLTPEISEQEHGFFYSRVGRTGFVEQPPLDARELDPNDLAHTTWYYTPIKRGRPSWVGPYTAHFLNEMLISSYLVPIYKSGTLIGVMGMDIPIDTLIEQVSAIKVYDSGYACLLDDQNRVVYHPEMEFGSELDLPVDSAVLRQANSDNELIRYTYNGEERQMSFTTLSNGMKLVVTAPTREVNASSIQLSRIILFITLAIIVIFSVIIMLVMRFITQPLKRLTAASQRLADADYDVELDYKSKDEVGTLTSAFQRMRDQLKANIEDLNRRVRTDSLTGLPNQRTFFELAEAEKRRLNEAGKNPVLLYFNLVGMKHYNRQYGFEEGDQLICKVADVLARQFGEQRVSRFGQDHFAAITDEERLEERLHEVFEECRAFDGRKTLPIRVGIYPDKLEQVDASAACDRAKYACDLYRGSYISGFSYFSFDMVKQIENVRYIINNIDQALEEDWVQVYFQPIVRAASGKVCDEEALARWFDPERGLFPPADFVPALEEAGLIYKLDLYMLDKVLEKMQAQEEVGLTVVPHSINLSRSDFDACDIVEEIRSRVDAAGFGRDMITVEITESIIGLNFDFMKKQIARFQELGFPVWMDDFGSGYSSLDVLQSIPFDLIKFDMSFMRKLDEGETGKIILTEMMKMATDLGVDTICEGVETEAQVRFLQEIGCSKLQGYYFCKPVSFPEILERYAKGEQIGFENPEESEYYEAISRVSLYDLGAISGKDDGSLENVFDSLPMGIIEIRDDRPEFIRSNPSYREFLKRFFEFDPAKSTDGSDGGPMDAESTFVSGVRECCEKGTRVLIDETMPDGSTVHALARRVSTNPVTGAVAVAIAVLSVAEPDEGATYADIARALARDYYNIYYVDLETEHFIEYRSPVGGEELAMERHGENFFAETVSATKERMYGEDRDAFLAGFTKENIERDLDERGFFTASYRLVDTGVPMRVNMKITRMEPHGHRIIIGISITDAQSG